MENSKLFWDTQNNLIRLFQYPQFRNLENLLHDDFFPVFLYQRLDTFVWCAVLLWRATQSPHPKRARVSTRTHPCDAHIQAGKWEHQSASFLLAWLLMGCLRGCWWGESCLWRTWLLITVFCCPPSHTPPRQQLLHCGGGRLVKQCPHASTCSQPPFISSIHGLTLYLVLLANHSHHSAVFS